MKKRRKLRKLPNVGPEAAEVEAIEATEYELSSSPLPLGRPRKTGKPVGRPKQPLCSRCRERPKDYRWGYCMACESARQAERTVRRKEARKAERAALAAAGAPLPEGRHPAFGQGPREPWRPFLTNREEIAVRRMGYSGARPPKACQGSGYRCSDMERHPTLEGGLRWHCGHYGVDLGTPGNFMPLRCAECVEKKGK